MSDLRCAACGGVYHPATGHCFSETMVLCGPCTRNHIEWLKRQMTRKTRKKHGAKLHLYDYAETSRNKT